MESIMIGREISMIQYNAVNQRLLDLWWSTCPQSLENDILGDLVVLSLPVTRMLQFNDEDEKTNFHH